MAPDSGPGPLALDFLKHVTNVHWGAPSDFAIGGTARDATQEGPIGVFFFISESSTDSDDWDNTYMDPGSPPPPPGSDDIPASGGGMGPRAPGMWTNNVVAMVGGKFKATEEEKLNGEKDKKIFVAGGFRAEMLELTDVDIGDDGSIRTWRYIMQTTALLFWSDDGGKTWTEVPCPVTAPPYNGTTIDVQVLYLAFDPATKTFSGDVIKGGQEGGVGFTERTMITSSDGKSWTIASSERRGDFTGNWISPFLATINGIKNNGLTEIINTDADPPVTLTYTSTQVNSNPNGGVLVLLPPWKVDPPPEAGKLKEGCIPIDDIPSTVMSGGANFKGIAYSNGRFLIAGSLMIGDVQDWRVRAYVCEDKGLSWKKTLDDNSTFMIADTVNNPPGCAGSCGCAGA